MSAAQTPSVLRVGTRGSALAMAQAGLVAAALTARGYKAELVEITTRGDVSSAPLSTLGGTGVFVAALREALLDGRVDLAVHSLKDLPTVPCEGLVLAAVPTREDPRDVLCARDGLKLADLPSGARLGTGSPRRASQLRALGLGLRLVEIRGNVDTRLRRVADGELDAVVLARAGLARLGRLDVISEVLDIEQMLPAPGQGALAVECRSDDAALADSLAALDDPASRAAVVAERSLLAALEAGCTAPVGAYAEVREADAALHLRGVVVSPDGGVIIRKSATGPVEQADALGRRLATEMLADGAAAAMDVRNRA